MVKKLKQLEIRVVSDFGLEMKNFFDNPELLDADKDKKVIYFESFEGLSAIFSAKRLQLLSVISGKKKTSINELSLILNRKRQAVSRDLHFLEGYGLVELKQEGKEIMPSVKISKLIVPLVV